ncbi:uncharacterized protein LOC124168277 [Ischnura elegans]|uniref:uncharacterized protein LOC124168277 n=1 Tax=Ischnura elegans TaxID=197161 RepID=UPI001ED896A4|nr:uncharacterized protein LOC124168277 [Ischnura elegans]
MPCHDKALRRMETTDITDVFLACLLASAALINLAESKPLTAFSSQQFNAIPSQIPSFVYYRDSQPRTQTPLQPQKLLFSPINMAYSDYLLSNNLKNGGWPPPMPGTVNLGILNPGVRRPQGLGGYEIREEDTFPSDGNNDFSLTATNGIVVPAINNPGFILQGNNGFVNPTVNNVASYNGAQQSFGLPGPSPSHQISSLRYASSFSRPASQQDDLGKRLIGLSPTQHQRQRSVASAGELIYRQQRAGAKPFLTSDSGGVQREGGEELSSSEGFLGQPYRRPIFVSAVGTPVSGVGQNPLYTADSVQASKLDEASDVKGVKSPGGIPSPGRLPVSHDAHFARPFTGYANNFGYTIQEDPLFGPGPPPGTQGRGPFILPPGDFRRRVINR